MGPKSYKLYKIENYHITEYGYGVCVTADAAEKAARRAGDGVFVLEARSSGKPVVDRCTSVVDGVLSTMYGRDRVRHYRAYKKSLKSEVK